MREIPVYVRLRGEDYMFSAISEAEALEGIALCRYKPTYGRRGHIKAVHVVERLTGLIHIEWIKTGKVFMEVAS